MSAKDGNGKMDTIRIMTSDLHQHTQGLLLEASKELMKTEKQLAQALEENQTLRQQINRLQPDPITGLMSLLVFEDLVGRFVAKFQRDNHAIATEDCDVTVQCKTTEVYRPFCLLAIEVDRYSLITDQFGKKFSQFVLKHFAESISKKSAPLILLAVIQKVFFMFFCLRLKLREQLLLREPLLVESLH